jgi:hypothetical protein
MATNHTGGITPYERKLWSSVVACLVLIIVGVCVADAGVPIAGLVLVTVGVGGVTFSFFGIEQPLWKISEGARSRNVLAVYFLVFGVMTITFEAGCAIPSRQSLLPTIPLGGYLLMTSIAVVLIISGYSELPRFLFSADAFEDTPKETRRLIGWTFIVSGATIQVGALTYGLLLLSDANPVLIFYSILAGILLEVAGIGGIAPSGRWWIAEGVLK